MYLMTKDKPYNALDQYYKAKYGKKVSKIALNAGFTCPNRDGKKGYGGCLYCSKAKSGDFAGSINLSIADQFNEIKEIMENKWKDVL